MDEWFITFTCNFLNGSNDQIGRMMEGLHTVCGYSTDMTVTANAGDLMASKLKSGMSVKEAYFSYAKQTQSKKSKNTACVFTTKTLANDHIWGYGTVGSDPTPYSKSKSGYIKYSYRCNW